MSNPTPCPECNRPRRECWASPCVHLKVMKAGSLLRLTEWVKAGGGRLVSELSPPCCVHGAFTGHTMVNPCWVCDDAESEKRNRALPADQQMDN